MARHRMTSGIGIQTHVSAGTCADVKQLDYQIRTMEWPWCKDTPYELGCRIKSSHVLSYRQPQILEAAGC